MAEQLGHIFHVLLVSTLLFLSTAAQYSYDYEEASPAEAPSVSYISATPDASPVATPGPDASYDEEEVDASSTLQQVSLHTLNVPSSTQGDNDAFGTSYGTMLAVDTKRSGHNNEIAAVGRAGMNKFLHSLLVASVSKTDKFIENVIMKRLTDPKVDSYTKECLETCKEVYEDSVGAMKKTMGDIQEGNYFKANVDVSAMSNDVDICEECVEQVIGDDREFDMFSKWLDVVTDKLLDRITGITS